MNTYRHAHFYNPEAQVCIRCGARYGNCSHTHKVEAPPPVQSGNQPRAYKKYKNAWTPTEDALLAELWRGGESQGYIAKCLDRPLGSVASRLLRLDLRGQRYG